jgi:4-amino-4-deoxy-L-arabinose transferase-like glycosyltransferase
VGAAARSSKATTAGVAIIVLGLAGHVAFRTTAPSNALAMACWLAALAGLLLVAGRNDSTLAADNRPVFANGGEIAMFLLIFGLTALLRLWNLSEIPPTIHGDSAECAIRGLEILHGTAGDLFAFSGWYNTLYTAFLPYAASLALVGESVLGLRLPSALVGTLSMIPLYFLVRGWLGRRTAQIATTLFALSHAAIHFSRIGLWNIQALFLELVAFAFLAAALRKGSALLASCAGIAAGLGFYTYTGGRLIVVVSATLLAIQLLLGPRRRLLQVGGFVAAGLAVAMTPVLVSHAKTPEILEYDRAGEVFALAEATRDHVESVTGESTIAGILRSQTVLSLRGFFNYGDQSGQYGTDWALTSPVTAFLVLAGLLLALVRFRDTESRLVLLWAGLGLLLGSILIIDPPSHTRLIVLFPVPFIFAALAIETMLQRLDRHGGRWMGLLISAVCVLVIGQAAAFNLGGYRWYVEWIDKDDRIWDVVQVVEEYGELHDYYFFGGPTMSAREPALRLFAGDRRIVEGINSTDIPHILIRDTVFIIPALIPEIESQTRNVGTVITERFPDSRLVMTGEENEQQLIIYVASGGFGAE